MALTVLGTVVLAVTVFDLLWTTLETTSGGGPASSRISRSLWRLVLQTTGGRRARPHARLRVGGFAVVLATFATWLVGLWAG